MGDLLLEPNGLVTASLQGARLVVRFTSPETRNPISTKVLAHLENVISKCDKNSQIKEVVFTGTHDVFASGADLKEIASLTPETAAEFAQRGQTIIGRISDHSCRTIAAINGFCYGGGLDLALACNVRIASSNATFCHPGTGLGIITGWGGTQRLPRLIGGGNACEVFFSASSIKADRALSIGLIDAIDDKAIADLYEF